MKIIIEAFDLKTWRDSTRLVRQPPRVSSPAAKRRLRRCARGVDKHVAGLGKQSDRRINGLSFPSNLGGEQSTSKFLFV